MPLEKRYTSINPSSTYSTKGSSLRGKILPLYIQLNMISRNSTHSKLEASLLYDARIPRFTYQNRQDLFSYFQRTDYVSYSKLPFILCRAFFVVESKPSPSNLAYTGSALPMHTDLPFYEYQPSVS